MAGMQIHWKIKRLDMGGEKDPQFADCLLKIEGRIECGGRAAGVVEAHYLSVDDPESDFAFAEFWDLDSSTCEVFEEIMDQDLNQFRDPIPWHLDAATGVICVHFIALRPGFRGIGMGRAVARKVVHDFADPRVGLVLLDARPLQHRPRGYDDFDEEVRDLPWNPPEIDQQHLISHFDSWGMRSVERTRFVVAAPEFLSESRAANWPPAPVLDYRNTCVVCGDWIDKEVDETRETAEGPVHGNCI